MLEVLGLSISWASAKGSRQKNRGLPMATADFKKVLGKIASRPTTLNLTIVLLFCIQLFDRQGFNDKGARWISSSKTKKTSLSSFLPALQGERCVRAGICCVVERKPFFECTGFSFHDFTDSLSRLAQRTGGKE